VLQVEDGTKLAAETVTYPGPGATAAPWEQGKKPSAPAQRSDKRSARRTTAELMASWFRSDGDKRRCLNKEDKSGRRPRRCNARDLVECAGGRAHHLLKSVEFFVIWRGSR